MDNKRQHIVPRSYLAAFVDPGTPQGQEPYLWVYAEGDDDPYARAPKKVAVESYYYSFTTAAGERDDAVDELLQQVESRAMPILRALDGGQPPGDLSAEARMDVAHFIGLLDVRVPRFRDTVEQFTADVMGDVAMVAASHPHYFKRASREAAKASNIPTPTDAEIEKARQGILSKAFQIKASPVLSLQAMVQSAPRITNYVYGCEWRILEAPAGAAFFTSDGPLVRITTMGNYPKWMGVGWETPWMETTLLLSPRTCLLISLHHPEGREKATEAQVREINHRTAAYAGEEVYSSVKLIAADLPQKGDSPTWVPATDALRDTRRPSDVRAAPSGG